MVSISPNLRFVPYLNHENMNYDTTTWLQQINVTWAAAVGGHESSRCADAHRNAVLHSGCVELARSACQTLYGARFQRAW